MDGRLKFLVVCAGNTCRSPMGAGLLLRIAAEQRRVIDVKSAGVAYNATRPVHPNAVAAMKQLCVDISHDSPKPVSAGLMEWATHVICVQQRHMEYLEEDYPQHVAKLACIARDVADPVDRPFAAYCAARDELDELLRSLWQSL